MYEALTKYKAETREELIKQLGTSENISVILVLFIHDLA